MTGTKIPFTPETAPLREEVGRRTPRRRRRLRPRHPRPVLRLRLPPDPARVPRRQHPPVRRPPRRQAGEGPDPARPRELIA
ncbi:hypothetical protein ACFSTC_17315 [Nonomuraea ferruginea]